MCMIYVTGSGWLLGPPCFPMTHSVVNSVHLPKSTSASNTTRSALAGHRTWVRVLAWPPLTSRVTGTRYPASLYLLFLISWVCSEKQGPLDRQGGQRKASQPPKNVCSVNGPSLTCFDMIIGSSWATGPPCVNLGDLYLGLIPLT